jgi:hypothetical protein
MFRGFCNKPYTSLAELGRLRYIFAIVGTTVRLREKSLGLFAFCDA